MSTQQTAIELLKNNEPTLEALLRICNPETTDLKALAMQEVSYFEELAMMNPRLLECDPTSVLMCVRAALKVNLTLDPSANLVYLIPSSVKNQAGQYVKVLTLKRTVNGELSVAYQAGTLVDHERPTVEYDTETKRVKSVTVKLGRPSMGGVRWETIVYDANYFKKWMEASHKKNAGFNKNNANNETLSEANALYRSFNGGIDPEFAIAKALRHSVSKLGTNFNAKRTGRITLTPEQMVADADQAEFLEAEVVEGDL